MTVAAPDPLDPRQGLAHPDLSEVPGRDLTIAFQDLVSMRVIAALRAAGVPWPRIHAAEAWLRQHTGCQRSPSPPKSYGPISPTCCNCGPGCAQPGTRARSRPFLPASPVQVPNGRRFKPARLPRSPRESPRSRPANTDSSPCPSSRTTSFPSAGCSSRTKSPANGPRQPGVMLDPSVQFGEPCIQDTRIPTSAIASLVHGGDPPDLVALLRHNPPGTHPSASSTGTADRPTLAAQDCVQPRTRA